jgi:hypothetical protein
MKKEYKLFQIRWKEPLGKPECPYMYRWVFNFGLCAIRIHHWVRSDDKRYMHNHPWWFFTFVLKGSYIDVSPKGEDKLTRFSLRFRFAEHQHYVKVPPEGAWTILWTGPPEQNWGFWVNNKFKRPLKYFHKYGHPPCNEQ